MTRDKLDTQQRGKEQEGLRIAWWILAVGGVLILAIYLIRWGGDGPLDWGGMLLPAGFLVIGAGSLALDGYVPRRVLEVLMVAVALAMLVATFL